MPLSPGARLGSYQVTAKIGEGGMGEVYRATDTKLNRDVALKVLPDAFSADAEQPDGDIASTNQGAIIGGPVLNAVFRLIRWDGLSTSSIQSGLPFRNLTPDSCTNAARARTCARRAASPRDVWALPVFRSR